MAYPFFSWFPHQRSTGTSYLEVIDLTEDLSDLQITPKRDVVDTFSLHGGRSRELLRPWLGVRITLDRFTDRQLFRAFSAMINHLERGGSIAFGVDSAKVWAARLNNRIDPLDTTAYFDGNVATAHHATLCETLVEGDEFVVESGPPLAKREYQLAGTVTTTGSPVTGGTIRIDTSMPTPTFFDYYTEGAMIRYSDFYPTLILPPGAVGSAMLTHDHRISYTLDLDLVYVIPTENIDDNDNPTDGDEPDNNPGGAAG